MCNLFANTTPQQAMRQLFKVRPDRDRTGNLPPLPEIFPDQEAPVIRGDGHGEREMLMMRWGIPGPEQFGGKPVTNVRNSASPHWRPWLERDYRCLIPANAFSEYSDSLPKTLHWFARDEAGTPFAFAGIWRPWTGTRGTKANPVAGDHRLFSFLTTEPNDIVRPIHAKAMPVILTEENWDTWLEGSTAEALRLQRPAGSSVVQVVSIGPGTERPEKPAARQMSLFG